MNTEVRIVAHTFFYPLCTLHNYLFHHQVMYYVFKLQTPLLCLGDIYGRQVDQNCTELKRNIRLLNLLNILRVCIFFTQVFC
jgi:hypothetical protein